MKTHWGHAAKESMQQLSHLVPSRVLVLHLPLQHDGARLKAPACVQVQGGGRAGHAGTQQQGVCEGSCHNSKHHTTRPERCCCTPCHAPPLPTHTVLGVPACCALPALLSPHTPYLCGWSGKPAVAWSTGSFNSSSMRKGSRLRSAGVPTVLRICTPAPSLSAMPGTACVCRSQQRESVCVSSRATQQLDIKSAALRGC